MRGLLDRCEGCHETDRDQSKSIGLAGRATVAGGFDDGRLLIARNGRVACDPAAI